MVLQNLEILNSTINILGAQITGMMVLAALIVIFAGYTANKISNLMVERAVAKRSGDEHATKTAKKLTAYLIYPMTFVGVLAVFGFPISSLGAAVGLIGLGLSFALKDMISNFISGVMIMISRPFKIGDQIEVSGEAGTVRDIMIRATEIKTYDGRQVIVPNSTLYNGKVINNTAYDNRRFEVIVGIGYEDEIGKAKELAIEALEEAENVETDPEPQVLVNELGGSSVNLKLRGWTKPSKANMVKSASEVTQLVKEKYDDAGIDIPYPIRTVYMNNEE